jgi:hypothetical protein
MKIFGLILLLFITSHSFGQLKTGLRFVMEGGSSIATLKQKEGSIYTSLSVSGLPTVKIWDKFQPSANFGVILGSIGWQFNPWVFLGIGSGLKYYYDQSDGDLPVFTDLRINFLNRKVSPTLSFKGGYNLADNLFGDLSAGICYSILPKTSLLLNLAITNYRFDATLTTPAGFSDKYPYSYDPGKIENIVIKNFFLQFRTGLIF